MTLYQTYSPDGGLTLWEAFDPGLQEELDETLAALGLERAVDEGKLAVALADISDPEDPRVASVNGCRLSVPLSVVVEQMSTRPCATSRSRLASRARSSSRR